MSTTLQSFARWATELRADTVPADVLQLARLQQLSIAGAVRAAVGGPLERALLAGMSRKGRCVTLGKRTLPRPQAIQYHCSLALGLQLDDDLLLGPAGSAGVAAGWAWAHERSVDELLLATVASNEICARVAAAGMFSASGSSSALHALSVAVACARLMKLDAHQTAQAMALALSDGSQVSGFALLAQGQSLGLALGARAAFAHRAALAAEQGLNGPDGLLEAPDGYFNSIGCELPLRNAFGGLGRCWLTRTLNLRTLPGHRALQVPVQAVRELLRRHIKAADKRLRVDQVEHIDIRSAGPAWALEQAGQQVLGVGPGAVANTPSKAIATLIAAHDFGPAQLDAGWLAEQAPIIEDLSKRVQVHHDPAASLDALSLLAQSAAPLFAGQGLLPLQQQLRRCFGLKAALPQEHSGRELLRWARTRPDRTLTQLGTGSDDMADFDTAMWRVHFPIEMKLYTTRGGWWPERRAQPEAGPGSSPDVQQQAAVDKFAGASESLAKVAQAALALDGQTIGQELLAALATQGD